MASRRAHRSGPIGPEDHPGYARVGGSPYKDPPRTPPGGGSPRPGRRKVSQKREFYLSRLGELLSTRRETHFSVPRGPPGGAPQGGSWGPPRGGPQGGCSGGVLGPPFRYRKILYRARKGVRKGPFSDPPGTPVSAPPGPPPGGVFLQGGSRGPPGRGGAPGGRARAPGPPPGPRAGTPPGRGLGGGSGQGVPEGGLERRERQAPGRSLDPIRSGGTPPMDYCSAVGTTSIIVARRAETSR